jgi:hypothetical protein
MARIHRLKTWSPYFDQVRCGRKPFEVRRDDRDYAEGDYLVLDEWSPATGYTKAKPVVKIVTYLLRGGQFGIEPGHVVLGVDDPAGDGAKWILDVAPPREAPVPSSTGEGEKR